VQEGLEKKNMPEQLDFESELKPFSYGKDTENAFDLLVVGCGPAGLGVADEAARRGLKVGVVDPNPLQRWPNNYGVWVDEFEQMGHEDCFLRTWDSAQVITKQDEIHKPTRLYRPYAQVDRDKLKKKLLARATDYGAEFKTGAVSGVDHEFDVSIVRVGKENVFARQVLDATGHLRKLVEFEREFTPGYQAAYGATLVVDSHPYDLDSMMFMDWRDDHLDEELKARNDRLPTFLYVMPYTRNKIFVEETSLVARPFVPFDDLKQRLQQRLSKMGIVVREVEDEEYCLIPMGGVLPKLPQRVLGIGGTAGMVHPATGYMVSKSLLQAPTLVDAIIRGFEQSSSSSSASSPSTMNATDVSVGVWSSIWPEEDRRQRTFMCFGMEILMQLDSKTTRRFFETFFRLPQEMWGGFLSWRISSMGLLGIGLSIFRTASNRLRFDFVRNALPFMPSFIKTFATASNDFNSEAWSGIMDLANSLWNVPGGGIYPHDLVGALPSGTKGENPTKKPIRSSNIDFAKLMEEVQGEGTIRSKVESQKRPNDESNGGDGTGKKDGSKGIGIDASKLVLSQVPYLQEGPPSTPPADLRELKSASSWTDDREWIRYQQEKLFDEQPKLVESLPPLNPNDEVDVIVAGVGPAGLALAGALAKRGVNVGLVGPDTPFTNNYGVWLDEFKELGLEHTLEEVYDDSLVVVDSAVGTQPVGRAYGRVGRDLLRAELLKRCQASPDGGKVRYYPGMVREVIDEQELADESIGHTVKINDGAAFKAKMVAMSTGHNRDVLSYEDGVPPLWQTAYGIEFNMPDHPWDNNKALFMDLSQSEGDDRGEVNGGNEDLHRVPSFLYVLPSKDKVFVEETCLISKVQVPFDELKRRLYQRLEQRLNITVKPEDIIEEEASWIPLGGPLPKVPQPVLGFGAAAGLVHPASGYSIVNSLSKAGPVADAIVEGLQSGDQEHRADNAWGVLWSAEQRRKMAFYQFGAEMISKMPLPLLQDFMRTFYELPAPLWKGFLSHKLSSPMMVPFALAMFVQGSKDLRHALISELASKEGVRMLEAALAPVFADEDQRQDSNDGGGGGGGGGGGKKGRAVLQQNESTREPLKGLFRRGQLATDSIPSGYIEQPTAK